ncbi:MAG: PIN domain-containing protein [bacterium]
MEKIIIDTCIFVALFNKSDRYFPKANNFIKNNKNKLLSTTTSVITEVMFLLDFDINAQIAFLEYMSSGGIKIYDILDSDLLHIAKLMGKYSDLPMDYTDATIVNVCEKNKIKSIATIDSDFHIYKYNNKESFNIVF